jgi:acyl-CoA synthetase (NDP forming)
VNALMNPRSIAVVGASQRVSRGTRVVLNLKRTGFTGPVYAINPRYAEVEGFPCYPAVSAVPDPVDCVVVAVPAPGVADVLEDAFGAGTRGAVVLSSGFGEGGHADRERIARLRDLDSRGLRICGPNCYGVFNIRTGAAAFSGGIADTLRPGPVGLVSQSGGFTNIISDPLMADRGIGFSYLVSCGNQVGVGVEDYLAYMVDDPGTEVIAAFVEGFHQPHKLAHVARRARERGKPIILLKSGRSEAGRAAVLSHTGSLAGRTDILTALLRRHGYVLVSAVDELCETIGLFTVLKNRRPFRREVVVITGSGGESSHVADAADAEGIALATLAESTRTQIAAVLPEFGEARNPVDGTGAMFENPAVFPELVSAVLADPQSGMVAVNLEGRQSPASEAYMRPFARTVADAASRSDKLIVAYGTSGLGAVDTELVATLAAAGVPYLAGTQRAMQAISALQRYGAYSERAEAVTSEPRILPAARRDLAAGLLPFMTARGLLADFGVPVIETHLVTTSDGAVRTAEKIGYPVVLKVEARGLGHRSDVGGVALGCSHAGTVRDAFDRILHNVRRAGVGSVDGVLVQPMAPSSIETFAGVLCDPLLGPAVIFGLGGIFVETMRDTVIEVPPISESRAREMVLSIRGRNVLLGTRGMAPVDVDAIARVLVALGDLAQVYGARLGSIDLNPLMVGPVGQGAVAVDALVELADSPH